MTLCRPWTIVYKRLCIWCVSVDYYGVPSYVDYYGVPTYVDYCVYAVWIMVYVYIWTMVCLQGLCYVCSIYILCHGQSLQWIWPLKVKKYNTGSAGQIDQFKKLVLAHEPLGTVCSYTSFGAAGSPPYVSIIPDKTCASASATIDTKLRQVHHDFCLRACWWTFDILPLLAPVASWCLP